MQIYLPIAELSLNVVLLLGMGFAIGFLSGMFGVGGGFILTPMLIFLGVPPAVAVGTSASQVVAASVSERGRSLAAQQHRRAHGAAADRRRLRRCGHRRRGSRVLRARGQLDLFVALTYVVLLGVVGALMLIESVRTLRAAPVKAGTRQRAAAASTPGSKACRSRRASATRASTPAPFPSWASAPSSAC